MQSDIIRDTAWGIVPQNNNHWGYGCNAIHWAGVGAFYGDASKGACWVGSKASGQPKACHSDGATNMGLKISICRRVANICERLTGSPTEIEDICAETCATKGHTQFAIHQNTACLCHGGRDIARPRPSSVHCSDSSNHVYTIGTRSTVFVEPAAAAIASGCRGGFMLSASSSCPMETTYIETAVRCEAAAVALGLDFEAVMVVPAEDSTMPYGCSVGVAESGREKLVLRFNYYGSANNGRGSRNRLIGPLSVCGCNRDLYRWLYWLADGCPKASETGKADLSDVRLHAYWDYAACGPNGGDSNWEWCNRRAGTCHQIVSVAPSLCASGTAELKSFKGTSGSGDRGMANNFEINGCGYAYYAMYTCTISYGTGRFEAPDQAVGEVQCCSLSGDTCDRTWWPSASAPDDDACFSGNNDPGKKTLFEAASICESQGMRLCTQVETDSGRCCQKGCHHDNALVWTSTTVMRGHDKSKCSNHEALNEANELSTVKSTAEHKSWVLRARGMKDESGCSAEDAAGTSLELGSSSTNSPDECFVACKASFQSTRFVQYHANKHCACFEMCDFARHPSSYISKADVYEFTAPAVNRGCLDCELPTTIRCTNGHTAVVRSTGGSCTETFCFAPDRGDILGFMNLGGWSATSKGKNVALVANPTVGSKEYPDRDYIIAGMGDFAVKNVFQVHVNNTGTRDIAADDVAITITAPTATTVYLDLWAGDDHLDQGLRHWLLANDSKWVRAFGLRGVTPDEKHFKPFTNGRTVLDAVYMQRFPAGSIDLFGNDRGATLAGKIGQFFVSVVGLL